MELPTLLSGTAPRGVVVVSVTVFADPRLSERDAYDLAEALHSTCATYGLAMILAVPRMRYRSVPYWLECAYACADSVVSLQRGLSCGDVATGLVEAHGVPALAVDPCDSTRAQFTGAGAADFDGLPLTERLIHEVAVELHLQAEVPYIEEI